MEKQNADRNTHRKPRLPILATRLGFMPRETQVENIKFPIILKIKQIKNIRSFILRSGAVLIFFSGIVSIVVSIPVKAVFNGVDPNGLFGHIGIVNGILSMIIGAFLFWLSRQVFKKALLTMVSGILMVVVGHLGAVMGALLVGTGGLLLCYIAGFWSIGLGIKRLINKRNITSN
jgi:hypothetical protein